MPSTYSDSGWPLEADQRPQADVCYMPGWFEMACSYAGGTGGLPPRPGDLRLTRLEQGGLWMDEAGQKGAEEVPLGALAPHCAPVCQRSERDLFLTRPH